MTFPSILLGSVWHTTTSERYDSIVRDGFLLPEPDLGDAERWGTGMGPSHYPFVRSIGGVSLFDFRDFDEARYSDQYPMSMWRSFVPCSHRSATSIWIEVDLKMLGERFIDGRTLLDNWKASDQLFRKIMPLIETACVGSLPTSTFKRVLVFRTATNAFSDFEACA